MIKIQIQQKNYFEIPIILYIYKMKDENTKFYNNSLHS